MVPGQLRGCPVDGPAFLTTVALDLERHAPGRGVRGLEHKRRFHGASETPGFAPLPGLIPAGNLLVQHGIEFFQTNDAVQVIDGDPGQPGAVSANASYARSHSPVFLLPSGAKQVVSASGQRRHRLGVVEENARDVQIVFVVGVLVQPCIGTVRPNPDTRPLRRRRSTQSR